MNVHDAGKLRGIERANNDLSFSELELGVAVEEGVGKWKEGRKVLRFDERHRWCVVWCIP
ncbi:ABC transporter ATP-binding protein [Sesbania bispinosa]|nr:ABC transporter ATP-binding protein [Sesbania bispinosa]